MQNPSSPLQSFNPHAVHYFTSAGGQQAPSPSRAAGLPSAAYPTHILVASTSPSRAQPPRNSSVPSQSTPATQRTQGQPVPIQSPQTHQLGFETSRNTSGGNNSNQLAPPRPIFEVFKHQRPLTPELGDVLKKRSSSWGVQELEESLTKN